MTRENRRNNNAAYGRKKYRIKSKFRFITSLVIMMVIIAGAGSAIIGLNNSVALTQEATYNEYVDAGETLWNIAQKYKSDKTDTRMAVYKICEANDISADQLQTGMIIKIPADL